MDNIKDYKDRLLKLIKEKAVILGERKLVSGKTSNYYIDGKMVTFDSEGIFLIGKIIFEMIKKDNIDAIGGLALGAVPIVVSVSGISFSENSPIQSFVVRAEKKGHGTEKKVEGHLKEGWRVVIVDDVITTGGSSLKAIEATEDKGGVVVKVISIVDRLEGAQETFEKKGYKFESIFTKEDLGL